MFVIFILITTIIFSILQKINGNMLSSKKTAKNALKRCLEFFDEFNIPSIDESVLCSFSKSLTELLIVSSDNNILQNNINLWLWCYKIAKLREKLDVETLKEFYKNNSENCLPTKALMVLMKAHEVIGEAQICCKYDVSFNIDVILNLLA